MNSASSPAQIAIIGMAGLFPGAKDLATYWQNILSKVSAIREAPDDWNPANSSDDNGGLYTRKGGFLDDIAEFDPLEFGIMPNSIEGGDPDHFLSLKIARDALKDADYLDRPFNREKAGIILGRGTYFNRGFGTVIQHGLIADQTIELLQQIVPTLDAQTLGQIRQELKASLPPFNAEMSPGLVPNVVTGRIANRLDLMGPNYLVDGACASSLIAVDLAIQELLSGRCDMMLAGGVQASTPPQVHMVFSQLDALSRSTIKPFDQSADGTLLSEGLGILVLKRLADAQKDGDRIYAVIQGIGTASDGKGLGLLAPRWQGQVLAIQRAYENSGIDPDTVTLVEAHGTGMPLGDRTEIKSLTHIFGQRQGEMPHRAIGSVKSAIGHCIPASGAASLIKMALALYYKVLPPTLCQQPHPCLEEEKSSFYVNTEARPWINGQSKEPRRAGIDAFGFGGIDAHAILEEYDRSPDLPERKLPCSWPTELFIFSGEETANLIDLVEQVERRLQSSPNLLLSDLAYTLANRNPSPHRLAIVASEKTDLQAKLQLAKSKLAEPGRTRFQTRSGIYYAQVHPEAEVGKTAFLFPGEGSQYPNMLSDLCLHFPKVRAWFDFLDDIFGKNRNYPPSYFIFPPPTGLSEEQRLLAAKELYNLDLATETVFTASMALYELLKDLEIQCDVMVGHSTGENTALIASGTIQLASRQEMGQKILELNQIYLDLTAEDRIPRGTLLTVGAVETAILAEMVAQSSGQLYLAMDNCPNQAVLFGNEEAIKQAANQLRELGGICTRLPFDRAYHTPLFNQVAEALREYYQGLTVGPGHTQLYTCATAAPFPPTPPEIRELALSQWSSQVRFRETIGHLYEQGVRTFVEVGPSSNLSNFVRDILSGQDCLVLASNSQRRSSLEQIQHLLAQLFVNGRALNFAPLYQYRQVDLVNLETASLEAAGNGRQKRLLDLTMPKMKLTSAFVHTLEQKFPSVPPVATGRECMVQENIELTSTLPVSPPEKPPLQEQISSPSFSALFPDIRLPVFLSHLDLMEEFLNSQARTISSFYTNPFSHQQQEAVGLPWVDVESVPLSFSEAWPFLGEIIEKGEGYLYCRRHFDLHWDDFIYDHMLGGPWSHRQPREFPLPVIPFTVSMEIIAEAAAFLCDGQQWVSQVDNVRSYRWLALERGYLVLDIVAQLQEQLAPDIWDVHVQLFQPSRGSERRLVFEGDVRLTSQLNPSPPATPCQWQDSQPSRWSDEQLYTEGMFHGPRLQGVKHIRQVSQQGIEADLEVMRVDNFFRDIARPIFQIDAPLLDAAAQLVAYWGSEFFGVNFHTFPFSVRVFEQYAPPLPAGTPISCRGWLSFDGERQLQGNFEFLNSEDVVIARVFGLLEIFIRVPLEYHQLRREAQVAYWSEPWQEEVGMLSRRLTLVPVNFLDELGGVIKYIIAHLIFTQSEREFWYSLPEQGSDRKQWLLGSLVAKETIRQFALQKFDLALGPLDIQLFPTESGNLQVYCPPLERMGVVPEISISQNQNVFVAAAVEPSIDNQEN